LINFNVPRELLRRFDYLNKQGSTTRTSTLVSLMDRYVRDQEERHAQNTQSKVYENDVAVGFWSEVEDFDNVFV
jgi:hypothetical protein